MKHKIPPRDPSQPVKSASELLRDNPNLPAGARQALLYEAMGFPRPSTEEAPKDG